VEKRVEDSIVVAINYILTVDGEVLDSTDPDGASPLEYLHGVGQIIPGLEKALTGMELGQVKKVTISPEEGYGEFDPDAVVWLSREDFPESIPLELGIELELQDGDGEIQLATIVDVEDERIQVDMNHPLAGENLHFEVTIAGLREATEEELAHGHAHGAHSH